MSHIRPYDIAMSEVLRAAVVERRLNPDGNLLEVGVTQQGMTRKLSYPWDRMKLGDFFFVPVRGQKYGPLQVRFRQVAARRDWELVVVRVERDGQPFLRVCLTLIGVRALKEKAQQYHHIEGIQKSDGRWTATRKLRYNNKGGKVARRAPRRRTKASRPPEVPPLAPDALRDPSSCQDGADATLSPTYDRDAVMRERLKSLGVDND